MSTFPSLPTNATPNLIGIVSFSGFASIRLPLVPISDIQAVKMIGQISSEVVGGSSNIAAGIRCAARMLANVSPNVTKTIILVADGEPNIEADVLDSTIHSLRYAFIEIECISVGKAVGARRLRTLCEDVGARYWDAETYDRHSREIISTLWKSHRRQQTASVLCVDCSQSMLSSFNSRMSRIDACQQAAFAHLAVARQLHNVQ